MLSSLKQLAKASHRATATATTQPNSTSRAAAFLDSASRIPFSTTAADDAAPCLIPAKDIVLSFKQWFMSGNNLLLSQIFRILKSTPSAAEQNPSGAFTAADVALSRLNLRLNEAFVLDVIRYGNERERDVLSCLKFFDWAGHQSTFRHTRATFLAIFKILSRANLTPLMLDFLAAFHDHRGHHSGGLRFHDTLVVGYAIAGKPDTALRLFGDMRFRGLDLDSFAYHVLLNALVEENCFDAVHVIGNQIVVRGYESDVTRTVMLKWYCKQNLLHEAEDYLRGALAADDDKVKVNGRAVGVLVQALCKAKLFEHAGNLMDEFRDSGVVAMDSAYSVWIRELVRVRKLDEALKFLERKKSLEGYVPSVFKYNILIRRLLRENRLEEAGDVLLEMKEGDISPDKVTMNAALCFFCKAGMVEVARELYDSRAEFGLSLDSMAYNYLINSFCGKGSIDQAYKVLQCSIDQGYFPGKKTFAILADALCREGKLDKMKELIMFALERNLTLTASTYDKFIRSLRKTRRVEDSYLLHELNKTRESPRWTTYCNLVHGFCKLKKGEVAARLLIEMQEYGHLPTRGLFREVICCLCETGNTDKQFFNLLEMQLSCQEATSTMYNYFIYGAGHARRPELAREAYEMMQCSGIKPSLRSDIFMLQSYLKSERISDALNFFYELRHRRQIGRKLYGSMILSLCKAKKADIALDMVKEMREKRLVPTEVCYEFLIQLLCWNKEYDAAVYLIKDLISVGRPITSFIGNIILLHSIKTQELYDAWVRLREVQMEISEMSIIGQLIGVFSGRITVSEQFENLEEVIENCFPLDLYTYNLLIRRLSNSNMDHACALFSRMCQKGYEPNQWTYDILVQGFFKYGRTDEGKRWLTAMSHRGFCPTGQTMRLI